MKNKFYLFLTLSALCLYSCTTDNETVSKEASNSVYNQKSLSTFDLSKATQLYLDMMKTTEYQDFKASVRDFNDKLSQKVSFDNKADWMAWINFNLLSTSFSSINEFETMYDDFGGKAEILVLANSELFTLMKKAKLNELQVILEPEFNHDFPVSSSSCQDECEEWCSNELDRLDEVVAMALSDIWMRPYNSGYTDVDAYKFVMQYYDERWWGIVQEFNICLGGC